MSEWKNWSEGHPEGRVTLWWRADAIHLHGTLWRPEWKAETVERRDYGNDYKPVWWPPCTRWDGWQRTITLTGLQWRESDPADTRTLVVPIKLKPCPFCGSEPKWTTCPQWVGGTPYEISWAQVGCCIAKTDMTDDIGAIVAQWNARATRRKAK